MEDIAKKPNYKIYCFKDELKLDKEVIERFYAENDDAAYAHLEEVKNYPENAGKELYYATVHYVCKVDEKGNKSDTIDIDDMKLIGTWIHENDIWCKKIWEEVKDFFEYWFVTKPKDL